MTANPLHVAIIIGSTREGRFGPTVAGWFTDQAAQRPDISFDVIDLGECSLPTVLGTSTAHGLGDVTGRLDAAEAFVIVTPEYNHSYPASLKNLIDWHYTQWQAKPVGFVSYGGLAGGLRAVEHLRPVFAELHAVTIRDTVSFHNPWSIFDDDGRHKDDSAASAAAKSMLDQLAWWGHALRDAKAIRPYAA
jgi:NAD(P)H-dependent FMN reductase